MATKKKPTPAAKADSPTIEPVAVEEFVGGLITPQMACMNILQAETSKNPKSEK